MEPLTVYNVNGTLNKKGTIRNYVDLPMTIFGKKTNEWLLVTGLGKIKIILGFTWLNEQNPLVNWKTGNVSFPSQKKKIDWKKIVQTEIPKNPIQEEVNEEEWRKGGVYNQNVLCIMSIINFPINVIHIPSSDDKWD